MRLASKGLGKLTLPFQLKESSISVEDGNLIFRGKIKEKKVNWNYTMKLEDRDIVNFIRLARNTLIITYLAEMYGLSLLRVIIRGIFRAMVFFLRSIFSIFRRKIRAIEIGAEMVNNSKASEIATHSKAVDGNTADDSKTKEVSEQKDETAR